MTVSGVRLQFSDVECFRENIEAEDADVVLTVVTDDLFGKSVYVDVMARDPLSEVVFSKLELNDAELNFKNKVAGLHTFCFKVSQRSRTNSDSISSPRVKKPMRTVTVDVQLADHDKVREDDVDNIMVEVKDVQRKVQRLAGTVVHLKMTGAQHHEVVVSKNRTVTFCSVGKLVILLVMFAVQPVVLNAWFSKRGKY